MAIQFETIEAESRLISDSVRNPHGMSTRIDTFEKGKRLNKNLSKTNSSQRTIHWSSCGFTHPVRKCPAYG